MSVVIGPRSRARPDAPGTAPERSPVAESSGDRLASCLYEGAVRHRRFELREHAFRHRLAMAYLDLDELPDLAGGALVAERPGLIRVRRRDLLGDPAQPLADCVREAVEARTGIRPHGPIRLLTQPRSWGLCFNPVSFYYCFDPTGARLEHVLAEVTNTPWRERHAYVISAGDGGRGPIDGSSAKALHVSPFMSMDHRYRWRVGVPGERLEVHIENHHDGRLAFEATLAMRRRALTDAGLRRMAFRYPAATLRVLGLIYGHALALKLKGVPLHPHPGSRT